MAQPPSQDFVRIVDFTAQPLSGALLNQAFDTLVPNGVYTVPDGVAGVIYTTDTALNVPNVPDADVVTKWQNYIWFRRPYITDITGPAKIYTWNNGAIYNVIFLRWIDTGFDDTSLQNQITQNTLDVAAATDVANNANTTATGASTQAAAAVATANAASAGIATALAAAEQAEIDSASATAAATAATTVANGANAAAQNALTQVANAGSITNLQPGTAGQRIRTNYSTPASNEYYSDKDNIVLVNSGGGNATAAGVNQLLLDTTVADSGLNIVSLAANDICLKQGVYEFDISGSMVCVIAGARSMSVAVYDVTAAVNVATQLNDTIAFAAGTVATNDKMQCHSKGYLTSDGIKKFRINATIVGGAGVFSFGSTLGYFKRIG